MLTQMASAKSERFNSVHSREKVDENEDPNMYQEVKSEKSVDREEDRKPVNTPHKENIFASATDFFFKAGPRGWVGWEDSSSAPQFLEYVFFLV